MSHTHILSNSIHSSSRFKVSFLFTLSEIKLSVKVYLLQLNIRGWAALKNRLINPTPILYVRKHINIAFPNSLTLTNFILSSACSEPSTDPTHVKSKRRQIWLPSRHFLLAYQGFVSLTPYQPRVRPGPC